MKIAIDLHGTYTENIVEYNRYIKLFVSDPLVSKVYIFSGSPENEIREYLRDNMPMEIIDHSKFGILSVVDFCHNHKFPMIQKESRRTGITNWYIDGPEEIWWSTKSVMCSIYEIDVLVDDKLEYGKYFGEEHNTVFFSSIEQLRLYWNTVVTSLVDSEFTENRLLENY